MIKYILLVLFIPTISVAQTITLTNPHNVDNPQATQIRWRSFEVTRGGTLKVYYEWLDSNNNVIAVKKGGNTYRTLHTWTCQDRVSIEFPETNSTCFSDVFNFSVRGQDVGTSIGRGLRQRIWNQMSNEILLPGNRGTLP